VHPKLASVTVTSELDAQILSDGTQIGDTKSFCDLLLSLVEKVAVIGSHESIIHMPGNDTYHPSSLGIDVVENEDGIISVAMKESKVG